MQLPGDRVADAAGGAGEQDGRAGAGRLVLAAPARV
jgi:hypothetical protein